MLRRISVSFVSALALVLAGFTASAQSTGEYSAYSPYSVYGLGEIVQQGSAFNRTQAGVGTATRNNRYLNTLNPAAITARDSLSVMADFTAASNNKVFRQGDIKSASNVVNITGFNVSLPIIKNMAVMAGLSPYAASGYSCYYELEDPDVIGRTGGVNFTQFGQGSVYEVHLALAYTFWKRLSLGAQFNYYFGYYEKSYYETFTNENYNGVNNQYMINVNGVTGKFGLQYEQPIGRSLKFCLGGTYQMKTMLGGNVENRVYASSLASDYIRDDNTDLGTLANRPSLAPEITAGLAVDYQDKIRIEFNYSRADWTSSNFYRTEGFAVQAAQGLEYKDAVAQSFRLGAEYTPNRNDVRYFYKRMSYRAGLYYNKESYCVGEKQISSRGLTLGTTIPVFRWYNGISIAVDMGQRGTLEENLVRENYINISVGINLFDIWFQKHQYN